MGDLLEAHRFLAVTQAGAEPLSRMANTPAKRSFMRKQPRRGSGNFLRTEIPAGWCIAGNTLHRRSAEVERYVLPRIIPGMDSPGLTLPPIRRIGDQRPSLVSLDGVFRPRQLLPAAIGGGSPEAPKDRIAGPRLGLPPSCRRRPRPS